jgi:PAS domain S-box-containing protein
VQEAAYALIPQASRAATHLRIGRLLVAHTPPEQRGETVFEIVNQLNRGAALITEQEEREQLAKLDLLAGQRAKASAAYASALTYLVAGAELLSGDCWERQHGLAFALELGRAECEFLTGALAQAERRLALLSTRAESTVERATVACLAMDLYVTLDQSGRAISVGLDCLRHLGIDWSPHPTDDEARCEYERIFAQLEGRTIEDLVELPLMSDPASLATLDVLTKLAAAAFFTDLNLHSLVPCRAINLSLERGHCDGSCVAYEQLGLVAGARFGDYQAAYRFGRLGCELVEQRGLNRFQARTYNNFGVHVLPWTSHFKAARDLLRRAFETANAIGDLTFVGYSCANLNTNLLASGDPLIEVLHEAEHGLEFAQNMRFGLVTDIITAQLGLVRTLRGLTPKFGSFDDAQFSELQLEDRFDRNPDLRLAECWYWVRKLQARFLAGDYASAIEASSRAQRLLWTSLTTLETAEYHFYGALSRAAIYGSALPGQRQQHLAALLAHHRQLEVWAAKCPQNFENRAALVGAEIGRIEGRPLDAERLYEQALRSAQANGFVHNEALANELAGRFYAGRGFEKIARTYLQDALYGYLRWGAAGKVRQLDELYPHLREGERAPGPTDTIGAPVEHLDLATVIKVSQAVSSEIVLERLLDTLMRTAIEHAGAQRGLLIVPRGAQQRIVAEATTSGETIDVLVRDGPVTAVALPVSILHYVARTQTAVILDGASADHPFAADTYIRRHQPRSILCLPFVNQAKLIGALYLENNLAPHAFTPARVAVLKLLASQAAISLENSRLYRELEEREAKIRRLVDANIIGIFVQHADGRILEANDAFLRMIGHGREDLAAGRLLWTELTPPEWHARTAQAVAEVRATGATLPFEKEYLRKDGTRVPVLVGSATFDERGDQAIAFVLDLSERKRAEEVLQESEERFRTLVQFSFDVYWETDARHRFVRQEFGAGLPEASPPGSELGKSRWEVPYLEPDEEAWRKHRETLDAHLPFRDFEVARPIPDGDRRYISVSGLPVFDKARKFVGYRGVGRNVTERKQAEHELRVSEERFRTFVDNATDAFFLHDDQGTILDVNRQACASLGYSREELIRMHPRDFDVDSDEASIRQVGQRAAAGGTLTFETRHRRKDGTVFPVEIRATQFEQDGRRFLSLVRDITERKRAERRLAAQHGVTEILAQAATMEEAAPKILQALSECLGWDLAALWRIDQQAGVLRCAELWRVESVEAIQFEAVTRASTFQRGAGLPGRVWGSRTPEFISDVAHNPVFLRATIAAREGLHTALAFPILLGNEVLGVIDFVSREIRQPDQDLLDMMATIGSQIGQFVERKHAENALQLAQAELTHVMRVVTMGELTASIVHEVKQPLAALAANSSASLNWLAHEPPNLDEAREYLQRMIRDCHRADEIITRIRGLVKRTHPARARLDVNEAIQEVLAIITPEALRHTVMVRTELDASLPPVRGDRVQLQQVVLNLAMNGVDAMKETAGRPRSLSIRSCPHNAGTVLVSIQDNGIGLEPENMARVFEAFYTTKPQGMGMGLSISRSIVEAHGGQLWFSANDGHGATFQFSLPTDDEHDGDTAEFAAGAGQGA